MQETASESSHSQWGSPWNCGSQLHALSSSLPPFFESVIFLGNNSTKLNRYKKMFPLSVAPTHWLLSPEGFLVPFGMEPCHPQGGSIWQEDIWPISSSRNSDDFNWLLGFCPPWNHLGLIFSSAEGRSSSHNLSGLSSYDLLSFYSKGILASTYVNREPRSRPKKLWTCWQGEQKASIWAVRAKWAGNLLAHSYQALQ